ncbi:MAG: hypothetical protein BM557_07880 [Flavobacterium sp. MedPE-SWcel]|uniref:hypothetical protein n=1 Tax=uncultured Flavobacterium sp. TaxID=165435 RepID=UPI000911796F|nr:hypothetical protein [uncultured Flavobacterium sp.]OIQ18124.1 MAG: hypothetical protein BM557_07880 [Flavobacterium sp. MedPE-SWcel]
MIININKIKLVSSILLVGLSITSKAQSSPENQGLSEPPQIDFEILIADEVLSIQNVFIRPIKTMNKFSVFNMLTYAQFYENKGLVLIGSTTLNYECIKNLNISGEISTNSIDGLRPTLGLNYTYIKKEMLFIIAPRFDLIDNKNFEAFLMYEYKPNLSDKINLYTRIQSLYNHNIKHDLHDRSYINLRLGLSFYSTSIGLGTNLDSFGPQKIKKESYGLFAKFLI